MNIQVTMKTGAQDKLFAFLLLIMVALSISSFNSNGFSTERVSTIANLLRNNTFVLIQEHWLLHNELNKLNDIPGSCSHSVSGMPAGQLLSGRPYGGCAIMWSSKISAIIEPISFSSNRICGIKIKMNNIDILLINIYMPTDTETSYDNMLEYSLILNEITSMWENSGVNDLIIGGDLKTDITRQRSLHTRILQNVIHENELKLWIESDLITADYIFESKVGRAKSVIDHFILSTSLFDRITSANIRHDILSLSDHIPINIVIDIDIIETVNNYQSQNGSVAWNSISDDHICTYQDSLNQLLGVIPDCPPCEDMQCKESTHRQYIDDMANRIVQACITAAHHSFPKRKSGLQCHEKRVPGWKDLVEPFRDKALFWQAIWKSCGSPNTGVVTAVRRRTRALYHRAIKQCRQQEREIKNRKIVESFKGNDINSFWQNIRKLNSKGRNNIPSKIDSAENEFDISKLFAKKFEDIYTSVSYESNDMKNIHSKLNNDIDAKCTKGKCHTVHEIT